MSSRPHFRLTCALLYVLVATLAGRVSLRGEDCDGDGRPDASELAVALRFTTPVGLVSDVLFSSLSSGDFDGDGDLDIALNHDTDIILLSNDGSGSFSRGTGSRLPSRPVQIVASDVDADEDLDLLTLSDVPGREIPNILSVVENDGRGKMTLARNFAALIDSNTVLAADFSGDDLDGVAILGNKKLADRVLWTVLVLVNSGSGRFEDRHEIVTSRNDLRVDGNDLDATDVDGDGDLDLLVTVRRTKSVVFLENTGGGSFKFVHEIDVGGVYDRLHATDLDSNGSVDLFLTQGTTSARFLNRGDGVFAVERRWTLPGRLIAPPRNFWGDDFADLLMIGTLAQSINCRTTF